MPATLERPVTKSASPKTPFDEQASGKPGWLGCSLWSSPLSYPDRVRCKRDVLAAERQQGERIVAEYREAERLAVDNDIAIRQSALDASNSNPFRKLPPVEIQRIQAEIRECDHQRWLIAQSTLRELRSSAADLAKVILLRLVDSFNVELQETAIAAERRLEEANIPLSNLSGDDFELWHNPETLSRHCWREVCRHALEGIGQENSVGVVQYFATNEAHTPFNWL